MQRFYCRRANFSLTTIVAPPLYASDAIAQPFGHAPFDINLTALGGSYTRENAASVDLATVQAWVNGLGVGPTIILGNGASDVVAIDPVILVPGVTAANIDGASRFSFVSPATALDLKVVLGYEAVNAADVGKTIWGLGSDHLAIPASIGRFAPLAYAAGDAGWTGPAHNDIFNTLFELDDTGRLSGQVDPVAAAPYCREETWQDFKLVVHDVAGPDGVYTFSLRINGSTVLSITTALSATRLWTPAVTSVDVHDGDLVCWLCEAAGGAQLDAEILWSAKPTGLDALPLGAGESAGEGGGV